MAVPNEPTGQRLHRIFESIKKERNNFNTLYQEVAEYVRPSRSTITVRRSKGEKRGRKVFDSTAIHAHKTLAAAIHSALTNPATQWFRLNFSNPELRSVQAAREWLQEVADIMFETLRESNFSMEVDEAYQDITAFGTFCLTMEEKIPQIKTKKRFNGVQFKAMAPEEYYFVEGADGLPVVVFFELKLSVEKIFRMFPDALDLMHASIIQARDKGEIHKEFDFIRVIALREGVSKPPPGKRRAPKNRPYAGYWIDKKSKNVVKEEGFYEMPAFIVRWRKSSGEEMGRGPGVDALPDIKTLNKAKELELRAMAKVIDPPLKRRHRGVISKVRSLPGGITDVRDNESLTPLYDTSVFRFDVAQVKAEELKIAIEKAFFIDQLQLPPVKESKTMSATEVEVRYEQMQKILGPTLGHFKYEFLAPLIERLFAMLLRAGMLPPLPAELQAMGGRIEIEYVSPFERSQKLSGVAATERFLDRTLALAQFMPEMLDRLDPDEVVLSLHEGYSAEAKLLRKDQDVQKIRQQRAEMMRRQQQMAEAQVAGGVAKDVGQARKAVS